MAGLVVFLIDESAAMNAEMPRPADGPKTSAPPKTKSESVATAVNAALSKLSALSDVEVALIGYKTTKDGSLVVGSRFDGPLAGRDLVIGSELLASPLAVEERIRRTPDAFGQIQETSVSFPVWYRPQLGDRAPQIAAFKEVNKVLAQRANATGANSPAPLVINISTGASDDGNPVQAIKHVQDLVIDGKKPIILQIHLSSAAAVGPTLYPANRAYLSVGPMRDLFERASVLPMTITAGLKTQGVTVGANARGMIYNAKTIDLTRLLNVVPSYFGQFTVAAAPPSVATPSLKATIAPLVSPAPATASQPTTEAPFSDLAVQTAASAGSSVPPISRDQPAFVLFVIDRSSENPYDGNLNNTCTRLQRQMNEMLETFARRGEGTIEVAIVSYGADGSGEADVRTTLEGGHSGKTVVRDDELVAGALRLDEFEEEISDGAGGIIKIPRKLPILVDIEPTASALVVPAFAAAKDILAVWLNDHPNSQLPPFVIHMTRGAHDAATCETAVDHLGSLTTSQGHPVLICQVVATEKPHKSIAYASDDSLIGDDSLRALWRKASVIPGAYQGALKLPALKADSRAMVINGKFDLAWRIIDLAKKS